MVNLMSMSEQPMDVFYKDIFMARTLTLPVPLLLLFKSRISTYRTSQPDTLTAIQLSYSNTINSHINSDLFPCTWGTFSTVALLVARLPPGSQASV